VGQGCQMVYFQTKNPNLGKFLMALDWKMLIYVMSIWYILRTFRIFYDHWVHFVIIRYIFSGFGIMHQEKSGNPVVGSIIWRLQLQNPSRLITNSASRVPTQFFKCTDAQGRQLKLLT
jgi:hypothetical protein